MSTSLGKHRPLIIPAQKAGDPPMFACDIPKTAFGVGHPVIQYPGKKRQTRARTKKTDMGLRNEGLNAENMLGPGVKRPKVRPKYLLGKDCVGFDAVRQAVTPRGNFAVFFDIANHFACFDNYALKTVRIRMTGSRNGDEALANAQSPNRNTLTDPNTTWHHVADFTAAPIAAGGGGHCSMQLVPTDIHGAVNHRGGVWQYEQLPGIAAYMP